MKKDHAIGLDRSKSRANFQVRTIPKPQKTTSGVGEVGASGPHVQKAVELDLHGVKEPVVVDSVL